MKLFCFGNACRALFCQYCLESDENHIQNIAEFDIPNLHAKNKCSCEVRRKTCEQEAFAGLAKFMKSNV